MIGNASRQLQAASLVFIRPHPNNPPVLQLALTLAGRLLGPILYPMPRRREEIYGFLDGFVLIGVAGLVLTEVLPDTLPSLADPRASGMAKALGMPAVGLPGPG